jgi:ribosomal protein L7/L12
MSSNQIVVLAALFAIAVVLTLVALASRRGQRQKNSDASESSPFSDLISQHSHQDVQGPDAHPAPGTLSESRVIETDWEPENASAPHALNDAFSQAVPPAPPNQDRPTPARIGEVIRAQNAQSANPPPPQELERHVRADLDGGRKIQAIKRIREATGCGLKQAKDAAERFAAGDASLLAALLPKVAPPAPRATLAKPQGLSANDLKSQVADLLGRGLKIRAVKLLREHTGWSLRRVVNAVDALQAGDASAFDQLGAESREATPASALASAFAASTEAEPAHGIDEAARKQLAALLNARRKIEAIKLVRERTGWGLKESKEYVEAMFDN